LQQIEALHDYADADAAYRDHHTCDEALAGREEETVNDIFLKKQPAEACDDFRRRWNDETVEQSKANERFNCQQKCDERAKA
jgi:hypothetical protein